MDRPPSEPSRAGAHSGWPAAIAQWFVACVAPLVVTGAVLAADNTLPPRWRLAMFALGLGASLVIAGVAARHLLCTWSTVIDLLGALREDDYGMRGRLPSRHHPLRSMVSDLNALSDTLRDGRRKRAETQRFLGKTLTALQNPVFVVDQRRRVTIINPAARFLIDAEHDSVIGHDVDATGLTAALDASDNSILSCDFPTRSGRWLVRRAVWYSEGHEHALVMLHDVNATLGEEERHAWQRLIRVLSHELNNSLTPIGSLAGSLTSLLDVEGAVAVEGELREGLEVIGRRAVSLARFLSGYGKLAQLPPLRPRAFRLDLALGRVARLEERMIVTVTGTVETTMVGDEDQLDQAFINLLRNAVESALPHAGAVRVHWTVARGHARITIEDEGSGLPERSALFVPFFTTKPDGSGIGLSLTRLIVEAHAGSVQLRDRDSGQGAVAVVVLPLVTPVPVPAASAIGEDCPLPDVPGDRNR